MQIRQVLNNNIVSAIDSMGEEVIVMGRGLGFDAKAGDALPAGRIEKIFKMELKSNDLFKKRLEKFSFEHLRLSNEIISVAKNIIDKRMNENLYITLTDHISYVLERYRQGVPLRNAMLFEIKSFYKMEFLAGQKAVQMIKERLDADLGDDEAGFIALHFLNAELDASMENMEDMTSLIRNILNLVRYQFRLDLDEDSLDYNRFVTHLRYLGQRIFVESQRRRDDLDLVMESEIQKKYPREYRCAEKISEYIQKQYNVAISKDDKIFLAVHICRLIKTSGEP